jgi:16S rRNA C967 or C1407 C5-methylase (RsmB/RsmF family)
MKLVDIFYLIFCLNFYATLVISTIKTVKILELAAAPGSKSSQLAAFMGFFIATL